MDYAWLVDRARSGEPVPIDLDRSDINKIVDFLSRIDGRGLAMQYDQKANVLWVVKQG